MRASTLDRALNHYAQAPHLVFWETTKACQLQCLHCRASAQYGPAPGELSTSEGMAFLDSLASWKGASPIVIFTGGDCLARADLLELVRHGHEQGLRMGIAPSVTPRLQTPILQDVFASGARSASISCDGAHAATHDGIRGIAGHLDSTLLALDLLRDIGFRLQVNTAVMARNVHEMGDIACMLLERKIHVWEVFFLVGTGRGTGEKEITAEQAEDVCRFLVALDAYGLTIRTVEAPFYRRVREQYDAYPEKLDRDGGPLYHELLGSVASRFGTPERTHHSATLATGDGRGIVFVGHDGAIHPSGFLPISLGNVRTDSLMDMYQSHPLFESLRQGNLEGACGECEWRRLCGGSRARAYAHTGDPLGSDPACIYAAVTA
ncbi:MAG: TIGR04053 family radical SAM/SPASM domain-containing protein [Candidatus Dormibacteria bacterium]